MKKVMGGDAPASNCDQLTGLDKVMCQYNNCMSGWDSGSHTTEQTQQKIDECCALTGAC